MGNEKLAGSPPLQDKTDGKLCGSGQGVGRNRVSPPFPSVALAWSSIGPKERLCGALLFFLLVLCFLRRTA